MRTYLFQSLVIVAGLSFGMAAPLPGYAGTLESCTAELVETGKKRFRKCRACHKLDATKKGIGPHLVGVVGRGVADVDGFAYSDAMKAFGAADDVAWDFKTLDKFLEKPKGFVKGTKMGFPGYEKADDRLAVICFLKKQGG